MSYDIRIKDAVTGETLRTDQAHHLRGGTYCDGGTTELWLNVNYNYAPHFYRVLGEGGIRSLYGKPVIETLAPLGLAALKLGTDRDPDYWKPTEGNAREALFNLLRLGTLGPDGVWDGD